MSDILAEVDEIMRQERLEKFFKTYGRVVFACVVGTIILTAMISGYTSWNNGVNAAGTNEALALLEAPDFPENVPEAALDMRPPLRGMVLMTAAGAFIDEEKTGDALALYKRVSADREIPGDIRDLALLMQVRLDDQGDSQTRKALLEPLWANDKSPWRHHARLEAATLAAGQGDFEEALEHLAEIQAVENLPENLLDSARALEQIYKTRQQKAAKAGS